MDKLDLPPHTRLRHALSANHESDSNALIQGYLLQFGPLKVVPMLRCAEVTVEKSQTIEHYVWMRDDDEKASDIKLSPHQSWANLLGSSRGIIIKQFDVFNTRSGNGRVSAIVRIKESESAKFNTHSGRGSIFSNVVLRPDQARQDIAMVWVKEPLATVIEQAHVLSGFQGVVPSTSGSAFGIRIEAQHIAEARDALKSDTDRFNPVTKHVVHKHTYTAKGFPPGTDPNAMIVTLKKWNWEAIFISYS